MKIEDEFAGQGGSYTIDAATGKRTLVERTKAADEAPPAPSAPRSPNTLDVDRRRPAQ